MEKGKKNKFKPASTVTMLMDLRFFFFLNQTVRNQVSIHEQTTCKNLERTYVTRKHLLEMENVITIFSFQGKSTAWKYDGFINTLEMFLLMRWMDL